MDGLELNKIAAAFLIALLVLKGGQEISRTLIHPKELKDNEHAYMVEGIGASESASGPTGPLPIEPFLANANIERGATLAKQCRQCHTLEKDGAHGIGPNLYGIVGDTIGRTQNFAYSRAMASMEGKWFFEKLSTFLFKPRDLVNGTKMAFAGIRKEQDRADLIAYLNTLSDAPLELPQPTPEEASSMSESAPTSETVSENPPASEIKPVEPSETNSPDSMVEEEEEEDEDELDLDLDDLEVDESEETLETAMV